MKLSALALIFRSLNAAGVRYLAVGGVAVNAHGYARLTHDLDLVLHLEPENTLAALRALAKLGYRPLVPVHAADFADEAKRRSWIEERNLQVLSMVAKSPELPAVDLFAEHPFDFQGEYTRAMVAEVAPETTVRFLALDALIEMKERSGRVRDLDDAEHLKLLRDEMGDPTDA